MKTIILAEMETIDLMLMFQLMLSKPKAHYNKITRRVKITGATETRIIQEIDRLMKLNKAQVNTVEIL